MNNNDIKYCIVIQTLYIYMLCFLSFLVIRKEWEKLHVYTRHEL